MERIRRTVGERRGWDDEDELREVCPPHGWTHTWQCWTQWRGVLDTRTGVTRRVDGHMDGSRWTIGGELKATWRGVEGP